MLVCSVSTFVFNANPLMRFDGYYVLADWLEIPNLRDRSNRYMRNVAMEYCLGVEVPPEPYMALDRKILFLGFAIISYIYRWIITFSILWFVSNWLPDKLVIFTRMLMIFSLASMVVWPIYRLAKNIHKRGRLPDMKALNSTITAIVVGVLVLAFFLVPLPVGRVRQQALVEFDPNHVVEVDVPLWEKPERPPVLEELLVRDGEQVEKDQILAVFSHFLLDNSLILAETKHRTTQRNLEAIKMEVNQVLDDPLLARKQAAQDSNSNDFDPTRTQNVYVRQREIMAEELRDAVAVSTYLQMRDKLVVRAPREGIVINPPRMDEVGKQWDVRKNQMTFCRIGDRNFLRARVPISAADRELILDDWGGEDTGIGTGQRYDESSLPVTIRVHGRGAHTWQGKLVRLEASSGDDKIPIQLTSRAGGPVAVKPLARPDKPDTFVPQSPVFFAYVNFDENDVRRDNAICPGTMGQVKIHCRWHSAAWFLWRTISNTFDLGLV